MLFQLTKGLNPMIRDFGCYFMALTCGCLQRTKEPMDVERLEELYEQFVHTGVMSEKCFVMRPDAIPRTFGLPHRYTGVHAKPTEVVGPDDIEILYFHYNGPKSGGRPWYHFVLGNNKGGIAYDPWPFSVTANEGELLSKRIFKP